MAMKIKDGLFIGDAETSQSEDFINDNKISNLINLAGRELPNLWSAHGLVYMTFNWEDRPDFKLGLNSYKHGSGGDFISDMVEFIDISIMHGISVLLFSKNGTGRSTVAVCIYLMVKYRWGFEKAFEYIYSKKPDVNLNRGFVQQLYAFDRHLLSLAAAPEFHHVVNAKYDVQDTSNFLNHVASVVLSKADYMRWKDWNPAYLLPKDSSSSGHDMEFSYDRDELILVYSYINSKVSITSLPGPYRSFLDAPPKMTRIRFGDYKASHDDSSSSRAHHRHAYPVRGILKGSREASNRAKEAATSLAKTIDDRPSSRSSIRMENKDIPRDPRDRDSSHMNGHISSSAASSSRASAPHDDLYGYVGVDKSESKSSSSSDYDAHGRQVSAEERLKKLVAGLTQPQRGKASDTSSYTSMDQPGRFSSSAQHDINKFSEPRSSTSSLSFSKSMPASTATSGWTSAFDSEDRNNSNSKKDRRRVESKSSTHDMLQTYEAMQRSGLVKATHDTNNSLDYTRDYRKPPSTSTSARNSWTDNPIARQQDNSDLISVDSAAVSTASGMEREPPRQYRRGSPAPRSQQRSANSNTASSSSSAPSRPQQNQGIRQPSPGKAPLPSYQRQPSFQQPKNSFLEPQSRPSSSQQLNRRGSNSTLASTDTIDSQSADVYGSSRKTSSEPRFSTPTRQLSKSSLDGSGNDTSMAGNSSSNARRYASPQVKASPSRTGMQMDAAAQIYAGRSSTPTRATWKY